MTAKSTYGTCDEKSGYVNHVSNTCSYSQTCQSTINPPTPPKRLDLVQYVNCVSKTYVYSSHQVSSQSLHSKCFPRFPPLSISQCPRSNPN